MSWWHILSYLMCLLPSASYRWSERCHISAHGNIDLFDCIIPPGTTPRHLQQKCQQIHTHTRTHRWLKNEREVKTPSRSTFYKGHRGNFSNLYYGMCFGSRELYDNIFVPCFTLYKQTLCKCKLRPPYLRFMHDRRTAHVVVSGRHESVFEYKRHASGIRNFLF